MREGSTIKYSGRSLDDYFEANLKVIVVASAQDAFAQLINDHLLLTQNKSEFLFKHN